MELLFMAARNLARNRRRSILSGVAIMTGVMVLLVGNGFIRGFATSLYEKVSTLDTGHLHMEASGYRKESRHLPLDLVIANPVSLVDILRSDPRIAAVAGRTDFSMEITNGRDSMQVLARAVEPLEESRITTIADSLVAGSWLETGLPGLVIGRGMAAKLGLDIGSTAFFTAMDRNSVRNLGAMTIKGIFRTGYGLLDDRMVFLDLGQADSFLSMKGAVTRVVARAADPSRSRELSRDYAGKLAALGQDKAVAVLEWRIIADYVVSSIESRLQIFNVIFGALFVLILVGIVNAMSMSVLERYREIGTLRAIGMKPRMVRRLFLYEGFWLGLVSVALGLLLGSIPVWHLQTTGLPVDGLLPADMPIPLGDTLLGNYNAMDYLLAGGLGIGASMIGSWIPARRAGKLPVLDALGNTR